MKKKLVLIVTALTLCAAIAVGGTLAYLSSTSDVKTNVFTYDNDPGGKGQVVIELAETEWREDKRDGDDKIFQFESTDKFGTETPPVPDPNGDKRFDKWGYDKAQYYIPGTIIAKNPTAKLKSEVDSYIGMSVSEPGVGWNNVWESDYEKLTQDKTRLASIDWNLGDGEDQWTYMGEGADGTRYFAYNGVVSYDETDLTKLKTTPLFTTVQINGKLETLEEINGLTNGNASFDMNITAYGVSSNVDDQEDWTPEKALRTQFSETFGKVKVEVA